jgi:hypothetical protein
MRGVRVESATYTCATTRTRVSTGAGVGLGPGVWASWKHDVLAVQAIRAANNTPNFFREPHGGVAEARLGSAPPSQEPCLPIG